MKKHGPRPDNTPNPWFAKNQAKRQKKAKLAKKARRQNRRQK